MPNDLIKTPDDVPGLIPSEKETAAAGENKGFVPTLKLIQGMANECGNDDSQGTKINQGDYYIGTDEITLGDNLKIVVVGRRAHALLIEGGKVTKETYDINSPLWKEIKSVKDDYEAGIVKFVGEGDWLLYLPDYKRFVTFFCGKAATYPLTVQLKKFLQNPDERRNEVDKELPWTNHFEMTSKVKNWGDKYKAMVPNITPLQGFDLENEVDKDDGRWASETFYAPLRTEKALEEDDR